MRLPELLILVLGTAVAVGAIGCDTSAVSEFCSEAEECSALQSDVDESGGCETALNDILDEQLADDDRESCEVELEAASGAASCSEFRERDLCSLCNDLTRLIVDECL